MLIKILGIDPALAHTGFCRTFYDVAAGTISVERFRLLETVRTDHKQVRRSSDNLRRARDLLSALVEEAQGCAFAVAEIPQGGQSATAAGALMLATGVLAACPIPLIEISPQEVKTVVRGSPGPSQVEKAEVIAFATARHPQAPWLRKRGAETLLKKNEHLADALVAVYAGLRTPMFQQAVAMARQMEACPKEV